MSDARTLLAHIALELSVHPENIAVESLGYIMSSSAPTIRALESVLSAGGAEVGPISEIRTQASGEDGARPDLAGFDEEGAERVLIEAKFWAGLTDRQPISYLNRLSTDKPTALLFVAPAGRLETLWAELRRRVAESQEVELGDGSDIENLRSVTVGGKRVLMLTSWRTLLDSMASQASIVGDSRTETDIRQLLGLTQRMDEDAFLPIRSDELGPETPRRMLGLPNIVEAATARGREGGWIDTSSLTSAGTSEGWIRYMRLGRVRGAERAGASFGYNFKSWAKHRDTPMHLRLYEWDDTMRLQEVRRRLKPLLQEDPPGVIYEPNYALVPIHLPTGVEETAVVESVVTRLKHVASLIDPHM